MNATRAKRAAALEAWAASVDENDLVIADTDALKAIAEFADRRDRVEASLTEAVRAARQAGRSWSEIGTMLGVSKQAMVAHWPSGSPPTSRRCDVDSPAEAARRAAPVGADL